MMTKDMPVTVTIYGSIEVNDDAVLDLSRGQAIYGQPFDDERALLKHLGINLIAGFLRLSQLDGWADLPDDAVTVKVDEVEAQPEPELNRYIGEQ